MMELDLVVRNGKVVTATDTMECDIGVRNGQIVALSERLETKNSDIVEADGRWITPGGVDAHCHLDQPSTDGSKAADDFLTGTRSALAGGTTTVIPFAFQFRGQSLDAAVTDYHKRAAGKAISDYSFHLIVTDPTSDVIEREIPEMIRNGYPSFKMYMTYESMKLNDRQILEVLSVAREHQGMAMIHAENSDCISWLTDQLEKAGKIEPFYHAASRPGPVEREATHRAVTLSELVDVPILIVHVSSREAVEEIRRAQGRGLRIYGETCPQYLFLTESDLDKPDFEGAKCVCSPPPRDKANQQVIWDGLCNGTFQVFSSDHSPTRFDDPEGKQLKGKQASFRWIPNGIPGIETRMPLLFSEGVMKGRIDIHTFVSLTATNPAKMYGIHPKKGTISIGADADLVIWDDKREVKITNDMLHHNVDYTPYEGMEIKGWPDTVLSRGEIVFRDGKILGQQGRGEFVPGQAPIAAIPSRRFV
jgi:dihydropyrimidinase